MRGRAITSSYIYDDDGRAAGVVSAPAFTEDDRAMLLGLEVYEGGLCPGCQQPKHLAWQLPGLDNDYWIPSEHDEVLCHSCTADKGEEVTYSMAAIDTRAYEDL